MVKTKIFSQTYPCGAGGHYSSDPKTPDFSPKKANRVPGTHFKLQTPTFGPRHIAWLGTIDNEAIGLLDQKSGFASIGILSQQYS